MKKTNWNQWKASQLRSSWRRRAKKIGIDPDSLPSRVEIQSFINGYNGKLICYLTNGKLTKSIAEFDHKIPTTRGGTFSLDNIGITSKRLNSIKGSMTDKEFLELMKLVSEWEDKGESLFKRLSMANNVYRSKRR